jgi:xanthine/CO dehydrogenase XdhC/CoxF family maturation factor
LVRKTDAIPEEAVKHWQETARVLDRVIHLGQQGRSSALAVVTHIRGSAYRRPGAKLLVEEDGCGVGAVSGGCLEADVREHGLAVIRSGHSRVLHYDTRADDSRVWGLGLGCDGEVDLVVLPISPESALGPWSQVRRLLDGDVALVLGMVAENRAGGGVVAASASGRVVDGLGDVAGPEGLEVALGLALKRGQSGLHEVGQRGVFFDVLQPPPKLLVCGAGDDARPLVAFAANVGFRVIVVDHRPAYLTAELLPEAERLVLQRADEPGGDLPEDANTYAVVKTHSLPHDTAWVKRLLGTSVRYVGILGPRARTRQMVEDVEAEGDERVFGPVGLDLGADGAEQVALSAVAELLTVRSRREPIHLRERSAAMHVGG